ncbi:Flap endonuclease 1 [Geodia barretti]|nr:Flap endonuclease 1 [Geodia barretti]
MSNNPKLNFPENWPYEEARQLFMSPEVVKADSVELKWSKPDEAGLVQFMVEDKGFSEDRIRNGVRKLEKCKEGATQGRLDSFFTKLPSPATASKRKATGEHGHGPMRKKSKLSTPLLHKKK